ncbi:MAG: TIGR03960 family B12-binding radical SAM protein [Planctomycetota bacterium]
MSLLKEIRRFLREIRMPGRYLGTEWNAVRKDPSSVRFRVALCYPDTYEIGMSHLGLSLLYHGVNEGDDQYAERCFAPWPDMAEVMKKRNIPLFSLETGTPLKEFDLIGFSLQHEMLFTNVLYMLDLAGIPLRSKERGPEDPLIVGGGSGAFTPEPMAEAFDLFLLGDGEKILPEALALFKEMKEQGASREAMLERAAVSLPFAYVPAFYIPRYDGGLKGMDRTLESAPAKIRPGIVEDLEALSIPLAPIQPGIRSVHDRITLEIMRGCTRGCRFCQAGMTRRPLRTRTPHTLLKAAQAIYSKTGYDEISLCSLSTSDYPGLDELVRHLNDYFEPLRVGVSLPSLRIGENLREVPALAAAVRKAGLTFAPEAATDRLRCRINKEITNEDLEAAVRTAYEQGWRRIKLYFMIGLPHEEDEDVKAIALLARRMSLLRTRLEKGPAMVTVSVSTFVPKAHTPFQWCAMARPEEVRRKQRLLLSMDMPRQIRFRFHDIRMSFVEAMLARGDRTLFAAVEKAFRSGARFDAWKDQFSFRAWERAFQEIGADAERILYRERDRDEVLPWDHIQTGPTRDFLRDEYELSLEGKVTEYCEGPVCHQCGIDPLLCAGLKKSRKGEKQNHD